MKSLSQDATVDSIRARLRSVHPDSSRRWGTLTPQEMLCHLADSFSAVMVERRVDRADTWFSRTVLKWLALRLPVPWPHGVQTQSQNDPKRGGTKPSDFDADLQRLEAKLKLFIETSRNGGFTRHPLFGGMSTADWLRWGYLHCDHHLRQFGV
jgi:hypothetical protein